MPQTVVTIYGKPGCHLCDEARAAVAQARSVRDFDLREIDVSIDPGLSRKYGERIPVVAVDGNELFELGVSAEELGAALDRASAEAR
jgi:glutaredoxin